MGGGGGRRWGAACTGRQATVAGARGREGRGGDGWRRRGTAWAGGGDGVAARRRGDGVGWGGQPGRRTATGPNQTVLSTWANRRQRGDRSRAADAQTAPPPVRRTGAPARASRQPAVPSPVAQTPPAPRLSPPPHAPWRARHDAGVTHAANQPFACLHARWEGVAPRGRSRCRTAPVAGARGPPPRPPPPAAPRTPAPASVSTGAAPPPATPPVAVASSCDAR